MGRYKEVTTIMQLLWDNLSVWTELQNENDSNDGIDIDKYGKNVNSEQLEQDTKEPDNPMDKIRDGLTDLLMKITGDQDDSLYVDVIDVILEYEAFIDLSRFKCIECKEYFGCDVFDNLCSVCYVNRFDESKRKQQCEEQMEDIVLRVEWDEDNYRYHNMISMPSLCSLKILFHILNRNRYRCAH